MEINNVDSFLAYYEKTRQITTKVIEVIPPDQINWTYLPGKFTLADMLRHIAAIERLNNRSVYKGCGPELADGYENIIAYFHEMHKQSMQIFNTLTDNDLQRKITALNGKPTSIGHFLRAMLVHEIHHRGALCIYLNLLNISTPPIIGLKEEDVIQLSK
jgi:uncharacterized damage-inducible protein DinB